MRKRLDDILERGQDYALVCAPAETKKYCLVIYTKDQYERILEVFNEKAPKNDKKARDFARAYFAPTNIIHYEGELVLSSRIKQSMNVEEAVKYDVIIDEHGEGCGFAKMFTNYTCVITDFIPVKKGRIRLLFRKIKNKVLRENYE